MIRVKSTYFWCLIVSVYIFTDAQNVTENEIRPYEFTFNIVDFQHRWEKKDDDGLITGEYGFITADGIYHETAYETDKTGDFIITKMRHRKITNLKDAEDIFKDNPEEAKVLVEALVKSCNGCQIPELEIQETSFVKAEITTVIPKKIEGHLEKKFDLAMKEMLKVLKKKSKSIETDNTSNEFSFNKKKLFEVSNRPGLELNAFIINTTNDIIRDMVDAAKKVVENDDPENEREESTSLEVLQKMANDLFYRFNYIINSHGHWEDGFRDGRKDGEYNAKFKEGIDTHVKYVSNEFGHQPNITLVPRRENSVNNYHDDKKFNTTTEEPSNRKRYFNWFNK